MKHATLPLFIPHLACKNDCVFCNQKRIAGTIVPPSDPYGFFTQSLEKMSKHFDAIDLAFFGGSFTGLDQKDMIFYLDAAARVKKENPFVTGIRLSTRPDYITQEILDTLKKYGVTAVELGAQSMDDEVLKKANRGHTAKDTERASRLIKENGFELVLQFMPGLPGDSEKTIYETASAIAALMPSAVRIYPCVVIKDTKMAEDYYNGAFVPLSVEQAVTICSKIVPVFEEKNIKIIRLGLHGSDLIQSQSVIAGPFHPAFGELVIQRIFYSNAEELLDKQPPASATVIYVSRGNTSKMVGNKRENLIMLKEKYGVDFIVNEKEGLSFYELERAYI